MTWSDNTVSAGTAYEYYVRRIYTSRTGHGYVQAGIGVSEVSARGLMLLLVDRNYSGPLAAEIDQLTLDLIGDGWQVKRVDVDRTATVVSVKSIVSGTYATDQSLRALYLLGHVPVPYSGGFSTSGQYYPPDGHPDHGGAWPCDLFYGSLNEGFWTDFSVNDTTPSRKSNDNIPFDGKYDQFYLYPDSVSFQIGRVDLVNMPAFTTNDTLLVKQYLQKAHRFKTKQTNVVRRGLIDDNFGAMSGEAFASSGYRDFSVMFGDSVFSNRDFLTSTKQGNYLFSYLCGAGSYTSASGVATTTQMNNDSINATFVSSFGSYFGDWDISNSFLRAPLCNKSTLSNAWSGRPYWMFHPMALGATMGYCAKLSQNNYSDFSQGGTLGYAYNTYPTFVHMSLMGDPSLRLHAVAPVGSVDASPTPDNQQVTITWTASQDGMYYVVLRSGAFNSQYKIVSPRLDASQLSWTDTEPNTGMNYYQVKAVLLEETASGTYYNTSLAMMDSASSTNTSGIGTAQQQHMIAEVYPNPSNGVCYLGTSGLKEEATYTCYDINGRLVLSGITHQGMARLELGNEPGIYIVRVDADGIIMVRKVVVSK